MSKSKSPYHKNTPRLKWEAEQRTRANYFKERNYVILRKIAREQLTKFTPEDDDYHMYKRLIMRYDALLRQR